MEKETKNPTTLEELSALSPEQLAAIVVEERLKSAEAEEAFLAMIGDLKGQISQSKKSVESKAAVVSFNKKKYTVSVPAFRHKGRVYKANELQEYPSLIEEFLAEEGQTLLVEVTK